MRCLIKNVQRYKYNTPFLTIKNKHNNVHTPQVQWALKISFFQSSCAPGGHGPVFGFARHYRAAFPVRIIILIRIVGRSVVEEGLSWQEVLQQKRVIMLLKVMIRSASRVEVLTKACKQCKQHWIATQNNCMMNAVYLHQ